MRYDSDEMERQAILATAARMCAAARTAPKAKGVDNILTMVLTGEEKKALAEKMREVAATGNPAVQFFLRDADNVDAAQALVLIGAKPARAGLPPRATPPCSSSCATRTMWMRRRPSCSSAQNRRARG